MNGPVAARLHGTTEPRAAPRTCDSERPTECAADDAQRFLEVVVVGNDDGNLGVLAEGVKQQVGGKVHVGAPPFNLLLRNLIKDGLLEEMPIHSGVTIAGMRSHEFFAITDAGREFIDLWLGAEDLEKI